MGETPEASLVPGQMASPHPATAFWFCCPCSLKLQLKWKNVVAQNIWSHSPRAILNRKDSPLRNSTWCRLTLGFGSCQDSCWSVSDYDGEQMYFIKTSLDFSIEGRLAFLKLLANTDVKIHSSSSLNNNLWVTRPPREFRPACLNAPWNACRLELIVCPAVPMRPASSMWLTALVTESHKFLFSFSAHFKTMWLWKKNSLMYL